jgi:hypothetical protein
MIKRKRMPVYKVKDGIRIMKYDSMTEAAELNNISTSDIRRAVAMNIKAGGYNWEKL